MSDTDRHIWPVTSEASIPYLDLEQIYHMRPDPERKQKKLLMLSFAGAGQNSLNGDDGGEEGGEEFISRSVRLYTIFML